MSNELEKAVGNEIGVFAGLENFELGMRMAKALCSSDFVPKEFQGEKNIGSCMIALDMAQRMSMNPLMTMQNLQVIHGKPSWSSQMSVAAINACGRFSPVQYELSEEGPEETVEYTEYKKDWNTKQTTKIPHRVKIRDRTCVAVVTDLRSGKELRGAPVSIKMAVQEGWYTKNGSKWQTMPVLMLQYRAATFLQRQYAPELLMGLPMADEVRDIIDVTPTREYVAPVKVQEEEPAEDSDDTDTDADGVPWNVDFHSGGKTKTSTGHWRLKKGVDHQAYAAWVDSVSSADEEVVEEEEQQGQMVDINDKPGLLKLRSELEAAISEAASLEDLDVIGKRLDAEFPECGGKNLVRDLIIQKTDEVSK
jgi:hypothetical protein